MTKLTSLRLEGLAGNVGRCGVSAPRIYDRAPMAMVLFARLFHREAQQASW